MIKLAAGFAFITSAAAAFFTVLPVPGANTVRVEITATTKPAGWAPDSGQVTGKESKKAFTTASAMATAATDRVTTWTVKKGVTVYTVNGAPALKPAVGDICNVHVTTPPTADRMTCAR